jgi:hypothetical protein
LHSVGAGVERSGFDTGTAGVDVGPGGEGAGGQDKSKSGKECGQVGNSAFEYESRSMRMMVGTRSRRGWGFDSLGSKRFGRGSCMTVGGFARRRNEQCIGYLRLFLGHCESRISINLPRRPDPLTFSCRRRLLLTENRRPQSWT